MPRKKQGYEKPRNPEGINQYLSGTAKKEKGQTIAVRLPLELEAGLRELVKQQEKSMSDLVAEAIALLLKEADQALTVKNLDATGEPDQTINVQTDSESETSPSNVAQPGKAMRRRRTEKKTTPVT